VKRELTLRVNDRDYAVQAATHHTLLDVLRGELGLVGAREGCGVGMCGACTVLVDDQPVSSCLLLITEVRGRAIQTVEGLAANGALHPLQQAFIDHSAFQCSYCTPGMLLAAKALLAENPDATEADIKDYLAGNLCRCGSYLKIVDAIRSAAARLQKDALPSAPDRAG
jgi:aerobic-type carbon monoxide dehydrogenase small subunit (CoxS/CutS family)